LKQIHVAIFEDDEDLAYYFQELLEMLNYNVSIHYSKESFHNFGWDNVAIILADYRNHLVHFADVRKEAKERGIPLIAISGGDMDFRPNLQKPFTVEEIQVAIENVIEKNKTSGFFSTLIKKAS